MNKSILVVMFLMVLGPLTALAQTHASANTQLVVNAIGTTQTTGLSLSNSALATSSVPQVSPALQLRGSGWNGNDSATNTVDYWMDVAPIRNDNTTWDSPIPQIRLMYSVAGGTAKPLFHMYENPATLNYNLWYAPSMFLGIEAGNFTNTSTTGALMGIGYKALNAVTTGYENLAIGPSSLNSCTECSWNTAVGPESGYVLTTGTANVFLGQNAGRTPFTSNGVTTGSRGTFLGVHTGYGSATQQSDVVAIGYKSQVSQSNAGVLGSTSVSKWAVGGLDKPAATLEIADAGDVGSTVLAEGNFATHAKWSPSGDWDADFTGGKAVWTKSAGWGYISQQDDDFALAASASRWYLFTYTTSNYTAGVTCKALFGGATEYTIPIGNDSDPHYFYIKSAATPTQFYITCDGASGSVSFDDLSLQELGGDLLVNGSVLGGSVKTVASATTTALPKGNVFHISGTTAITTLNTCDSANAGRAITLIFDDALTFTDGNNLKLAGNMSTGADDTISLVCDGSNWYEKSRSAN